MLRHNSLRNARVMKMVTMALALQHLKKKKKKLVKEREEGKKETKGIFHWCWRSQMCRSRVGIPPRPLHRTEENL